MAELPHDVQRTLVQRLIAKHPLPWRIDHDWTVEVLDAKGNCVIKLKSQADAEGLIHFADQVATEMAQGAREVEELMKENE